MSLIYKKMHSNNDKKLKKRCRNRDNGTTTTTTTTTTSALTTTPTPTTTTATTITTTAATNGGNTAGMTTATMGISALSMANMTAGNSGGSSGNGSGGGSSSSITTTTTGTTTGNANRTTLSGSHPSGNKLSLCNNNSNNNTVGNTYGGGSSSNGVSYSTKRRLKKATKNKTSKNSHYHKRHNNNKCYKLGAVIGVGAFGEVRECVDVIKNRHYAVKIVDVNRWCDELKHRIDNEIKLLRLMNHRHIISLVRVYQDVPLVGKYCIDCGCTSFNKKSFPRTRYEQLLTIPKSPHHRHHTKKMKTSKSTLGGNGGGGSGGGGDASSPSFSSSSSGDWSDSSELNMEEYVLHSSGNACVDKTSAIHASGYHFKHEGNTITANNNTTGNVIHNTTTNNPLGLSSTYQRHPPSGMENSMKNSDRYGNAMSMNTNTERYEDEHNHDKTLGGKNTGNSNTSSMHDEMCKFCGPHAESQHTMEETRHVTLMVQELAVGGEMFSMIKCGGAFDEDVCRYYFRQLIFGVQYLHNHGIVHRDLKLENLVFSANFDLKIVDFGLATTVDEADRRGRFHSGIGSLPYTAPEVKYQKELYSDRGYKGQPADIWSTAVILYVMLVGKRPFKRPLQKTYGSIPGCPHFGRIMQGIYPAVISVDAQDLLSRMFMTDPDDRCTIEDIISHPWFNGTVPNSEDLYAYMIDRSQRVWKEEGIPHMIPLLQEMHHKALQEDRLRGDASSNENVQEEEEVEMVESSPSPPPNPLPQLPALAISTSEKRSNASGGTNSGTVTSSNVSTSSVPSLNDSKSAKGTTTPPRTRPAVEESTKAQPLSAVTTTTVASADKNLRSDYGNREDSEESEGELTMPRPVNMTSEARAVAEVAERAYQWERQQALERKRRRRGLAKEKSPAAESNNNKGTNAVSRVPVKPGSTNTYIADNVEGQKSVEVKNVNTNLQQSDTKIPGEEHKSNIAITEAPANSELNEGQTSSNKPPTQPPCSEYMMSSATLQEAQFAPSTLENMNEKESIPNHSFPYVLTESSNNQNSKIHLLDGLGKESVSNEIKNNVQSQEQEQKHGTGD